MSSTPQSGEPQKGRRDFLVLTGYTMGVAGLIGAGIPFVQSLQPAADTQALASIDVNLKALVPGQAITVMWQGKPVFIRYRTPAEIERAKRDDDTALIDPETDAQRFPLHPQWLVVIGICTHLGCVPLGQKASDNHGDFEGWFCPCHGSHYDISARIRKGPAPKNLVIPPHSIKDNLLTIG